MMENSYACSRCGFQAALPTRQCPNCGELRQVDMPAMSEFAPTPMVAPLPPRASVVCRRCSTEVGAEQNFCPSCGADLRFSPPPVPPYRPPARGLAPAVIRRRSMAAQVLLTIVTFAIYPIYWFYSVACELRDATGSRDASPGVWTFLLFVPFAGFYSVYKFGELYERWSPDRFNRWLVFVLYFVFSPAVWFIVQTELNRAATGSESLPRLAAGS